MVNPTGRIGLRIRVKPDRGRPVHTCLVNWLNNNPSPMIFVHICPSMSIFALLNLSTICSYKSIFVYHFPETKVRGAIIEVNKSTSVTTATAMCTLEKRGEIFFLTLTADDEHRLNPALIDSLRSALRQAKDQSTRGSALITAARGKFFSNGFDLAWAQSAAAADAGGGSAHDRLLHMVEMFRPAVADLIALPMPTIAAVTGHAAAAGMMLALSHDYVLMRSDRGVLYMSELDLGMTFPDYFTALVRSKVGSSATRRDILLKAAKMRAAEAVATGIVDSVHESGEATVEAAVRLAEELVKRKWDGEVYADIRKSLYPELCGVLGLASKGVIASPRL